MRQLVAASWTCAGRQPRQLLGRRQTITFDPTVFATAQTITLTAGQLELSNTSGTETITGRRRA